MDLSRRPAEVADISQAKFRDDNDFFSRRVKRGWIVPVGDSIPDRPRARPAKAPTGDFSGRRFFFRKFPEWRYNAVRMNTAVIRRGLSHFAAGLHPGKPLALVGVLALAAAPATRDITLQALSDAYFQVSVFVAATLAGLLLFEKIRRQTLADIVRRNRKWRVVIAAGLGAIPGCGGAIVVTTQYTRGAMSFGGVVAALTSTMGDAAFLLLAKSPKDAAVVFAVCFVTGIITGHLVDKIHGEDFLRAPGDADPDFLSRDLRENPVLAPFYKLWILLFLPGAVAAVFIAAQVDVGAALAVGGADWVSPAGAAAGMMAIVMWTLNPLSDIRLCTAPNRPLDRRVVDTTNFITFWVLCGFVAFELFREFSGADIGALFQGWIWLVPAAAVLVGFIPGCGPQIIVTSLYLAGAIPFSAQLANAISNDGDALFPAVAVAPRAAVAATLYSAVPALLLGYGWMALLE